MPKVGERIDLEDVQRLDALDAAVGVLVEQRVEDGAGLLAVLGEDVALAHVVGALPAGERRLVEGDVADEVEGVVVPADLLGQLVEEDALLGQLLDDGLLAVSLVPGVEERVEGGVRLAHRLARVVLERLGDELAVAVEYWTRSVATLTSTSST